MNATKLREALESHEDESGDEGLDAARELCAWFLGDPGWADNVLRAYTDPDWARRRVQQERD
jgi:hypothetical protein